MEKYWFRLKYGFEQEPENILPTGDKFWDTARLYLHNGLMTIIENKSEINPTLIELWVEVLLQSGRDLHCGKPHIVKESYNFIHSDVFDYYCQFLGLDDEIVRFFILKSVENKPSILNNF